MIEERVAVPFETPNSYKQNIISPLFITCKGGVWIYGQFIMDVMLIRQQM
jgi:hypothetical protein